MKNFRIVIIAVFLLSAGSFLQQAVAQGRTRPVQPKTQEEIKRELELQVIIEEQKKELNDQIKKMQVLVEEAGQNEFQGQQEMLEELMEQVNVTVESANRAGEDIRVYSRRGDRVISVDEPFIFTGTGPDSYFFRSMGDSERTTWDFTRSVKENTFAKTYTFDVDKSAKSVLMSVMGDCRAGEIRIKIVMPNGNNYSDIVIDEFGNLNWRKSFAISETENQDKTGEWKFQITSTNATGYFKISLQTN